jgi:hypothetical protein
VFGRKNNTEVIVQRIETLSNEVKIDKQGKRKKKENMNIRK